MPLKSGNRYNTSCKQHVNLSEQLQLSIANFIYYFWGKSSPIWPCKKWCGVRDTLFLLSADWYVRGLKLITAFFSSTERCYQFLIFYISTIQYILNCSFCRFNHDFKNLLKCRGYGGLNVFLIVIPLLVVFAWNF